MQIIETKVFTFQELSEKAKESAWDWLRTDECVDELIIANQYTFTESGKRFD